MRSEELQRIMKKKWTRKWRENKRKGGQQGGMGLPSACVHTLTPVAKTEKGSLGFKASLGGGGGK